MSRLPRIPTSAAVFAFALVTLLAFVPEAGAGGMTFTVNSTADTNDFACTPDAGGCTLREAINAANTNTGHDTIDFDPSVFPPDMSVGFIYPTSQLPFIEDGDGVTIDGTDAGVYIGGSGIAGSGVDGLHFRTNAGVTLGDVAVRHLTIESFSGAGIKICAGEGLGSCEYDVDNI